MKKLHQIAALAVIFSFVSGCGFWGDKGEEVQPSPLVSFESEKDVKLLWSASIGSGLGSKYQQIVPAIDGDKIFAVDSDGTVKGFLRDSGQPLWSAELDIVVVGGIGAGVGKVAVTSEEGLVIVLNAEDGSELWRSNVSSEATAPVQFNLDIAVVQLINGKLVAFDAATGEHRWTHDSQVPRLTLRGTSAPVVASDVTFAGFASGKFVAIDNVKGLTLWEKRVALPQGRTELERMVDIDGRPLLVDRMLYVTSYQGRLVAINPFNAQVVWSQNVSSYRSLAAGFGNVYISESNDSIQAFDRETSASVWRQSKLENRSITSPAAIDTALAVGDYEGYIHFMSQIDGHFIARYKVDSSGLSGDMVSKDGVLYALSNGGRLVALSLQ